MKQVELLSPAGSAEGLEAALRFGADAVYLGGPFLQLRAASAGFDREGLCAAVAHAHARGKKVYVTVNAFAGDEDILALGDYARFLADAGADAAIVSDLGALLAKEAAPTLAVHISTQANCCNFRAARAYYDMGASRIVLARELSLEQIAALRGRTPPELELEAFVHGAMCMAYSGRCMISAYLNARSANAGACTQPCRWQYARGRGWREDGHTQLAGYELHRPTGASAGGGRYLLQDRRADEIPLLRGDGDQRVPHGDSGQRECG